MNIAFPTLLILLFLLPGFIFTLAFYKTDNEPLSYLPLTYKVIFSLSAAFLLHMLFLWLLSNFSGYKYNLPEMLVLISGAQSTLFNSTIKSISSNEIRNLGVYLVMIYAFSYILGKLINWIFIKLELDRFKIFRFDNPWYYLFKGYDLENINRNGFIVIIISAVIEVAGQGYLYRGELEDFYFDKEGNLERLVLRNTSRRKVEEDKTDLENTPIEKRFYPIDGTYFVIKYSEIKNLNVQFIELDLE
jgi:hypothetical protein